MRENPLKHKRPGSTGNKLAGLPDLVTTCPRCGGEIGLWSEEPETRCIFCEYRVFDREKTIH